MNAACVGSVRCRKEFTSLLHFSEDNEHEHWLGHQVLQKNLVECVQTQRDTIEEMTTSAIDGSLQVSPGDLDSKLIGRTIVLDNDVNNGPEYDESGQTILDKVVSLKGKPNLQHLGEGIQHAVTQDFESLPLAPSHTRTTFTEEDRIIMVPPLSWAAQQRELAAMPPPPRPQPQQLVRHQTLNNAGSAIASTDYFISYEDHEKKQAELLYLVAVGSVTTERHVNDWFHYRYGARPNPSAFAALMNQINNDIAYIDSLSQENEDMSEVLFDTNRNLNGATHETEVVDNYQRIGPQSNIQSQSITLVPGQMEAFDNYQELTNLPLGEGVEPQHTLALAQMREVDHRLQNGVANVVETPSYYPISEQDLKHMRTNVSLVEGPINLSLGYRYTATGTRLKPSQLAKTPSKYWAFLMDLICKELPRADKIFTGALLQRGNLIRPPPTVEDDGEDDDYPPQTQENRTKLHAAYSPAPTAAQFIIVKWQECIKCHQVFNMDNNHEHCCIYHPGCRLPNLSRDQVWGPFYGSSPAFFQSLEENPFFMEHFDWTCCNRQGDELGCKVGRHAPAYVDIDGVKKRAPFPPQ